MLEAHPREKSIIVNYKLEAAVYGDNDVVDPMLADRKVRKKTTNIVKAMNHFWLFQCHNNGPVHNLFNNTDKYVSLFSVGLPANYSAEDVEQQNGRCFAGAGSGGKVRSHPQVATV